MLVAWRFRKRERSLIQWFDPRAWIIFYLCFLFSTLAFWDVRFLLPFFLLSLVVVFTSGVKWSEIRRAFVFIIGFVFFFAILTFLTGRGGTELYKQEHLIRQLKASFSIFGWTPTLDITVERAFFAVSQFVRVFSIAVMTILIPYSLNPALYGITFKGLGLPDNIAYAMDLRAFGVGPRTWLVQLHYHLRDRILIALGVLIFLLSLAVGFVGLGKFWVPPALIKLVGG